VTVAPGAPCPAGYAKQPGPSGGYSDATRCTLSTAAHREILGISSTATTQEANAILATKQITNISQVAAPAPAPAQPVPLVPVEPQHMATSAPIIGLVQPQNSLLGGIIGGIGGFITGGPAGAVAGAIAGSGGLPGGGGGGGAAPTSFTGAPTTSCPSGYIRVGSSCVATNPVAALPGGQPLTTSPSGTTISGYGNAVMGQFGAALQPAQTSRVTLRCPPGAVLGKDSLCYNKRDISKKQRKWPYTRPPVTVGDMHAIQRADRARKRLVGLTKKSGAYAAMKKPALRGGSRGVITKAEAARALRR